jgi:hypothetical protein
LSKLKKKYLVDKKNIVCNSKKSFIFAPVKIQKNASEFDKYILVVALTSL